LLALPDALEERELLGCLAEGWELDVADAQYLAVGFGSYHWDVTDAAGLRHFVTVDDLDHKGWLGHDRDTAFDGLRAAFDAALALRLEAGLGFVVAPTPTARGEAVRRMGSRYSVALFPFVDGSVDRTPGPRADVVRMLAELHGATSAAQPMARRRHLDLPERHHLEAALRELDRPWAGGPFSEPARALLAGHASDLWERLRTFDRLAAEVATADADLVITHGEPHWANVLRGAGQLLLIDWDTVGLASPERDLWHVTGDAEELALYERATGRRVDPTALAVYRRRWEIDDISLYTRQFRSAHTRTPDTEKAWRSLDHCLRSGA
jgi:spectinomycin phosphotransferase